MGLERNCFHFTVYQQAGWRPIGYANLRDIDYFHGVAEFGISLHREFWNQGFGTETAKLVLAYGFRMLNLHSIYLTVDGVNPGGQRAYSKAGFREVGRYREAVIVERERYDLIMMDAWPASSHRPKCLPGVHQTPSVRNHSSIAPASVTSSIRLDPSALSVTRSTREKMGEVRTSSTWLMMNICWNESIDSEMRPSSSRS